MRDAVKDDAMRRARALWQKTQDPRTSADDEAEARRALFEILREHNIPMDELARPIEPLQPIGAARAERFERPAAFPAEAQREIMRAPQERIRAPQEAIRAPQEAIRAPQEAIRAPQEATSAGASPSREAGRHAPHPPKASASSRSRGPILAVGLGLGVAAAAALFLDFEDAPEDADPLSAERALEAPDQVALQDAPQVAAAPPARENTQQAPNVAPLGPGPSVPAGALADAGPDRSEFSQLRPDQGPRVADPLRIGPAPSALDGPPAPQSAMDSGAATRPSETQGVVADIAPPSADASPADQPLLAQAPISSPDRGAPAAEPATPATPFSAPSALPPVQRDAALVVDTSASARPAVYAADGFTAPIANRDVSPSRSGVETRPATMRQGATEASGPLVGARIVILYSVEGATEAQAAAQRLIGAGAAEVSAEASAFAASVSHVRFFAAEDAALAARVAAEAGGAVALEVRDYSSIAPDRHGGAVELRLTPRPGG